MMATSKDVIQASVVLGPVLAALGAFPVALFFGHKTDFSTITSFMFIVWLFGLIPAFLGGISFCFSRYFFKPGYLTAGVCGGVIGFVWLLFLGRLSFPELRIDWLGSALTALYFGAIPALIIRRLTFAWFPSQAGANS
jgi:hypothetical protein